MIKDLLKEETPKNMKNILIFVLFNFFQSCYMDSNYIKTEMNIQDYINKNFNSYKDIHEEITLEIENHKSIHVQNAIGQLFHPYMVDKLIIFNKEKSKFYTTVNTIRTDSKISSDRVQSLFGVKIEGKWYIYLGRYNLVALREGYKYDKYEPFTWEELSYVAHEQMFGSYVSLDWKGNLVINYAQLDADTNTRGLTGKYGPDTKSFEEEAIELYNYYMDQKIDSTQLAQIKEDIIAGKDKIKDPIEEPTIAQKYFGIGVPIFESKAWKKFIDNKNREE